jgi:hypothetical protein
MKASIRVALLLVSSCFVLSKVCAQSTRTFNQNASRSNHTRLMADDAWTFAAGGGTSLATNSNEKTSFRGSGIAGKFSANYYFDKIGLGVSSGILTGSVNDNALNRFITERKFPVDQLQISKTNPFNSYLLAGPTVRFGNLVTVIADIKGGLFLNNPGIVSINQTGATRALYRFEAGEKSLFPGFSGSVNIAYPINSTTQFFINTDYLQSRSSVRLLDPSGGIDVATQVNRDMKLVTAGIGIIKTFSGDRRTVAAKKQIGNNNHNNISSRELSSGRPSGRRDFPAANDLVNTGEQGPMNQSCGPVTQRTTNSDGSTNELTFACPDDAAAYNDRISMNVTVPKQTQGATFGEKVNAGLHAAGSAISQGASRQIIHRDLAARNIISGRLTWQDPGNSGTIVTNESVSAVGNLAGGAGGGAAAASYARQTNQSSFGTLVRMYARDAGSGMASGKREKGSGIATGRRQYQPVYMDNSGTLCSNCMTTIQSNPLYTDKGTHGENPMHKDRVMAGGEGIGSIGIELIDIISGAIIAQTKTGTDGNFFFANVPDGAYNVRITGSVLVKKGYDVTTTASTDLLGAITLAPPPVELYINNGEREDAPQQRAGISTSRSNIRCRSLAIVEADVDGDGEFETLTATASMNDGSSERLNVASGNSNGRKTIVLEGPALQNSRRRVEVLKSNRPGDPVANNIRNITISGNGTSLTANATFEDGRKLDVSNQLTLNAAHNGVKQYNIILADLNDDGLADAVVNYDAEEIMNGVQSGRKMIPVTVPDIAGAQRNVVAPFVPGGSVVSAAMRPGTPIGGIIVKGGKNPGGVLRTTQTNEDGEFEFSNLEAGNYIVTLEQELLLDNETTVTVGNRAQDHNSSRSNKTASMIANDPDNGTTGNKTKAAQAQDHNSSRSNKTSSIVADDDGNGNTAKNKDKMPVKWAAPELLKSISVEADLDGDGEFETDVTAKINDEIRLNENGDITAPQQKAGISTSRSNIRNRSGFHTVSDKLYIGYGNAEINGKIVPVKIVYKGGLKDTLKTQV